MAADPVIAGDPLEWKPKTLNEKFGGNVGLAVDALLNENSELSFDDIVMTLVEDGMLDSEEVAARISRGQSYESMISDFSGLYRRKPGLPGRGLIKGMEKSIPQAAAIPSDVITMGKYAYKDRPVKPAPGTTEDFTNWLNSFVETLGGPSDYIYQSFEEFPKEEWPMLAAGETLGFGATTITGVLALAKAGKLGKYGRMILDNPRKFLTQEGLYSLGLPATGAYLGELYAPGGKGRFVGEMTGGFVAPYVFSRAPTVRALSATMDFLKSWFQGGRTDIFRRKLFDALEAGGEDPGTIFDELGRAGLIEEGKFYTKDSWESYQATVEAGAPNRSLLVPDENFKQRLTVGQMTSSKVISEMEAKLMQKEMKYGKTYAEQTNKAMLDYAALYEALTRSGDPQMFRIAAKMQDDMIASIVDRRLNVAQANITELMQKYWNPNEDVMKINREVSTILDDALRDARTIETRDYWGTPDKPIVPRDILISQWQMEPIFKKYDELSSNTQLTKTGKLPGRIEKEIKAYEKSTPTISGNLIEFRSELLEQSRRLSKQGKYKRARIYSEMANGVLNVLGNVPEYKRAVNYSRRLNKRWTETFAGREGQENPETVLSKAFESGDKLTRPYARQRFQQIEDALNWTNMYAGSNYSAHGQMERFLRMAAKTAIDVDGNVNYGKLTGFMQDNELLLRKFPELYENLQDTAKASDILTNWADTNPLSKFTAERNALSQILNTEDVSGAIQRLLFQPGSRSNFLPVEQFYHLARAARTGGALDGLKTSVMDALWDTYMPPPTSPGKGTVKELYEYADGFAQIKNRLTTPIAGRGTVTLEQLLIESRVFNKDEISRLKQWADEAALLGRQFKMREVEGIVDPTGLSKSFIADSIVAYTGLRAGAASAGQGGPKLHLASRGRQAFEWFLQKMPMAKQREMAYQAMFDRRFFLDIMKDGVGPEGVKRAQRMSKLALINLGLTGPGEAQQTPESRRRRRLEAFESDWNPVYYGP